jgi:hypothetical protein
MSHILDLSRSRFYQLLDEGIFPPPLYDVRTRRPFYSAELQQLCCEIKESGLGFNGQFILFYSPRTKPNTPRKHTVKSNTTDTQYKEYIETLQNMGLNCTASQVSNAIDKLFPDGLENIDQGVVIRDLFRYIKNGV